MLSSKPVQLSWRLMCHSRPRIALQFQPVQKILLQNSYSTSGNQSKSSRASSSSNSPATRPSRPASSKRSKTSGKQFIGEIKEKWTQLNKHPRFRLYATTAMLLLYAATAYAGVQYLYDTKYKAIGAPNPYKSKEQWEQEQKSEQKSEQSSVDEPNVSTSSSSSIPAPRDTTDVFEALAKEYDGKIWLEELAAHIWWRRRQLMKHVQGDVLEVSCGTGRNISYFNPHQVSSVTFSDSSRAMLEVARTKFHKKFPKYQDVQYVVGRAEDLVAKAEGSGQKFDTIFETFGLCSHEDPAQALKNFKQLLRPSGKVVLLEHGRSKYDTFNDSMDKKAEQRMKDWGCRWNLDIGDIVRQSGLEIEEEHRYHFGTTYFYVLRMPDGN